MSMRKGSNTRSSPPPAFEATNPFASTASPAPATRRPAAPPVAEAPPAYQPPITTARDNPYAFLRTFDTVFLIDDSGSMAGRSWRETQAALSAITPICTTHDADGIDIHFLNQPDNSEYHNITRSSDVNQMFESVRPYGGTPTGTRLNALLKPYLRDLEIKGPDAVKPLNIIVITDGVPSDDVESVILNAAKKLEKQDAPAWQIGIQFFQVGNERGAAEALKELDDGLVEMGCPRDIVDTVPWVGNGGAQLSADGILKVTLGAVNRRLDRKRNSADALRI